MATPAEFQNGERLTAERLKQWTDAVALLTEQNVFDLIQNAPVIKVMTPGEDSATWDAQPVGAIEIVANTSPSTRYFLCGLLVQTNSDTVDKGRGIFVDNAASISDGIYVHNVGGGVGIATETTDTSPSSGNSYGYANQVDSRDSIGEYTYSLATSGGPKLLMLEQRATAAYHPTAQIVLKGNAAHCGVEIYNVGANASATAMRVMNHSYVTVFHVNAEDGSLTLAVNIKNPNLPSFANNAAAITGGLSAGHFYLETGSNPKKVCCVY